MRLTPQLVTAEEYTTLEASNSLPFCCCSSPRRFGDTKIKAEPTMLQKNLHGMKYCKRSKRDDLNAGGMRVKIEERFSAPISEVHQIESDLFFFFFF